MRGFVMPDAYYTPKMGNVRKLTLSIGKNARLNRGAWWLGSDGGLLAGAVIFGASVMIVALDGRGLAGVAMRLCMHILSAGNSACVPCRLEALHAIRIGWRPFLASSRYGLHAECSDKQLCMQNGARFPLAEGRPLEVSRRVSAM